jgi:2-hydroxy-6-oxonona-2,4-dienedioate hydrolase
VHGPDVTSGFAALGDARLYYEVAGEGQPFVMIHAGVADSRQWNNEFVHFAQRYRVVRYDLRGYGRSEPVEGEFSHMGDLVGLLDQLGLHGRLILMGCSMGGGLAMDFALEHPALVDALLMVGSGPSGLELDVRTPEKFEQAEAAWKAGDLDLLAELETQIWFDGEGRAPAQVDPGMRALALEMNRRALVQEARHLGKRLPDANAPAAGRLAELKLPVLIIVGEHDTPYILAASDYMLERLPSARKEIIVDAAHLPNMDHPAEFQRLIEGFLEALKKG